MTELLKQRWRIALHESGHLLVGKIFLPDRRFRAEVVFSSKHGTFCGLCSNAFQDHDTIRECVFTAAGHEGERFAYIEPTATYTPSPEPGADVVAPSASQPARLPEEDTVRAVMAAQSDAEYLAAMLAKLYYRYECVRDWQRIHRHWRSRARLILRQNKGELLRIANILFSEGIFVYSPGAGASDGVGE